MKICIFSGAAQPHSPELAAAVTELVTWCATSGHTIVNGGIGAGMMHLVGQTALDAGGNVTTIYPSGMRKHESHTHQGLSHIQVKNLHDRLEQMTENADCFIALPGGIGTLHEIFQVWADVSLAYHKKPLHIFNFQGFYNPLIQLINGIVEIGYIHPQRAQIATFHTTVQSLQAALSQ